MTDTHADQPTERETPPTEAPSQTEELIVPPAGWLLYASVNAEYRAAVEAFALPVPESFTFPDGLPAPAEDERVLYGVGTGLVFAYLAWQDAVHAAAVDAHRAGDDQAAGYWVEISSRFEATPVYNAFIDHAAPNPWRDEWIPAARAGDFTALAEVVDAARVASTAAPAAD